MHKWLITWILLLSLLPASGQSLTKLGEFTSYEQGVAFLPGPVVVVHNSIEDSQTKLYRFRSGRFIRVKDPIPSSLKNWSSFNWLSIDSFDQIDLGFYINASEFSYLPAHSKVKALVKFPGLAVDKVTEIVCYSVEVPEQDQTTGGTRDLHLLLLNRKSGPEHTDTQYTKLADVLVTNDSIFGAMMVELQPVGTFVVVYWEDASAAHAIDSITVYRLNRKAQRKVKRTTDPRHAWTGSR